MADQRWVRAAAQLLHSHAADMRNRPGRRAHSDQSVRGADARDAPTAANLSLRGGLRESEAQSLRSDPWAAARRAKARSYAAGPGFGGREPSRFLGTKRWKSQKLLCACFSLPATRLKTSRPKSIPRTPPLLHKRGCLNRGHVGGRSRASPYGRLCRAFRLFTLFCGIGDPKNRREVNELALKSNLRSARRLLPLISALLLAALLAIPSSGIAQAQVPPDEIVLVNADRDFVERKKGGEFVARPVFDRKIVDLFYAVRDADTGDWISAMYRVKGGEKKRSDGWEYPDAVEHPDLDRDRAYLLVMLAVAEGGERGDFYAVVPIHQSGRIWDKILSALSPARWARAFAGWVIEGVHGTLCGVVDRASGEDADN